jgi:hypothetical protein
MFCGRMYMAVGPGPYGGRELTLRRGTLSFVVARTAMNGTGFAGISSGTTSNADIDCGGAIVGEDGIGCWTLGAVETFAVDGPSPTDPPKEWEREWESLTILIVYYNQLY